MAGAKKSTWIGGTAFVAAVIAALFWFLLISPSLASASDVRGQADQVKQQNDLLSLKITKLAAESKKLPDYKNQLAQIQTQIPTTPALSAFLRELDATAVAHGVTIVTVTPASPTAVTLAPAAAAPTSPTAAPSDGTATGSTPGATPTPAPTADTGAATGGAAPAATGNGSLPAGFTAVSYSIDVIGTYDNTLAFLSDLQNVGPRLFLVSAITATGQQDGAAGGGKPATKVGDQELVITGYTYEMPDPLAAAKPAPTATPAPLPAAVPGKDPLVPVAGK